VEINDPMPREHLSRREVLHAIQWLPSLSELAAVEDGRFQHELDLEVIVYGRNYNGRKIGPYVRLFTYDPGETIIREGDWGGNTFYLVVSGEAEVFLNTTDRGEVKVSEVPPGRQFGEISVLAGVPHNATVRAPSDRDVQVIEVQRPALRLLRKLSGFSESLDRTYLRQGLKSAYQRFNLSAELSSELIAHHDSLLRFRVFAKNHVLFREQARIDYIYLIQDGWLRRTQASSDGEVTQDFMGHGHCYGLEGVTQQARWPYTVTLMGRSEVLMISIAELRQKPILSDRLLKELSRFAAPATLGENLAREPKMREQVLASQEKLINTGLVDGTNLLVMDMDLCVRCGRCSLACHKIHGQSRLLRRGIHITRLEAPQKRATQEVLAPAVCLHCKDPECLTGCPTGAIGRFSLGQIDIDPKTCIGCGDCAANCPYNAISMIPRKAGGGEGESGGAGEGKRGRRGEGWKRWLRVAPEPLPPAVTQTDDLLAVKCNLCTGTTLNRPGSKTPAYGCEENCPTGALARINPREYFTEIEQIEGLAFLDQTHAVGRNLHRSDPPRRLLHLAGLLVVLLMTAAAVIGIERYGLGGHMLGFFNMRWLTGLVGLIGIGGTMTYPIRRQIYKRRAGPLRYWMLAHSYLGVATGIILLLHGGAESGGLLTIALRGCFDLVILTGLFGAFCYFAVPRLLTQIEGDPLLLDDLKARRSELQKEIAEIAGSSSEAVCHAVTERVLPRFLSFAFLLRQYVKREKLDTVLTAARQEFKPEAAVMGNEERNRLIKAVEAAATLRRVEALILLHRLLKVWLPPHVILTSLMLALMFIHIIQVVSGQ
jgi:Fe-S-cluster-containing dehydrogenase component/CRP-like cAMP-binding protein